MHTTEIARAIASAILLDQLPPFRKCGGIDRTILLVDVYVLDRASRSPLSVCDFSLCVHERVGVALPLIHQSEPLAVAKSILKKVFGHRGLSDSGGGRPGTEVANRTPSAPSVRRWPGHISLIKTRSTRFSWEYMFTCTCVHSGSEL